MNVTVIQDSKKRATTAAHTFHIIITIMRIEQLAASTPLLSNNTAIIATALNNSVVFTQVLTKSGVTIKSVDVNVGMLNVQRHSGGARGLAIRQLPIPGEGKQGRFQRWRLLVPCTENRVRRSAQLCFPH